ncbi:MAG: response regulator transcription factor [Tatlockia sp.]|nr:response regulator transcription factor [Tatlockia sp.]
MNQRIFIIEDNLELCEALCWLFESVNLVVEKYSNAEEFLTHFHPGKMGCLITDVRMPGLSGIELIEKLPYQENPLSIIVMTAYGDIPMAIRAMKAGATDFILKPCNEQNLLELVQQCLHRNANKKSNCNFSEKFKRLTHRETQIIQLIMEGKLNKEIAFELSISQSTVEVHRANIMKKMETKNLAQLIKMFIKDELKRECNLS